MEHTHPLQDELIGALIGLARAISGNEDLITDATDQLILKSLTSLHPQYAEEASHHSQLLLAVAEEKKRIVPDCAVCCNPCGRTENYDVENLRTATEDVRILKYQVLSDIQEMASHACTMEQQNPSTHKLAAFLYKALFALGIDYWTAEKWSTFAEDVRQKKSSYTTTQEPI